MTLIGIRPAGEAGHRVELAQQLAHQLLRIVLRAQLIELPELAFERLVRVRDRSRTVKRLERSKADPG